MFVSMKFAYVASLLALVVAAPAEILDKRATVLADGNSVKVGTLPNWSFIYRSSGYLAQGGCSSGSGISTCYNWKLSSNLKKNIDPDESTGSQKIQTVLLSSPSIEATGGVSKHTFKIKVDSALTSTPKSSVPLVQLVSKEVPEGSSTTVSLDLKNNKAGIYLTGSSPVASVPLSRLVGKTTLHTWKIKGGPNGFANITITDAKTGATILSHNAVGQNSWDSYRVRIGTRRVAEPGIKQFNAAWGDYVIKAI